jgi:transposase-like protein
MKKSSRRDPAKERFWHQTLKQQAESGQSVRAFCRDRQLTEAAFYFWRRELKQREAQKRLPQPDRLVTDAKKKDAKKKPDAKGGALFVPVVAQGVARTTAPTIEMTLPSGSVLRWPGADATVTAEMIAALEARLC